MQKKTSEGFKPGCGITIVQKKIIGGHWEKISLKENRKGSRKAMKVATAIVQA